MKAPAEDEKQPPLEGGAFNLEEHSSNMAGNSQDADRIITETLQALGDSSNSFENLKMIRQTLAKWEPNKDELDKLMLKKNLQMQISCMSTAFGLQEKYLKEKDPAGPANKKLLRLSKENDVMRRIAADYEHQLNILKRKESEMLKPENEGRLLKEELERVMDEVRHLRSVNEELQASYQRIKDEKEKVTKSKTDYKDIKTLLRETERALQTENAKIKTLVTTNRNILNRANFEMSLREDREKLLFTLNTGAKFSEKQIGALSVEDRATLEGLLKLEDGNASVNKATKKRTLSQSEKMCIGRRRDSRTRKRKPESHRMEEQKGQNNLVSPENKQMSVEDTLKRTGMFVGSLEDKSTDYELESKNTLSTSSEIETAENKEYSDQSTAKTKPCNEKSESRRSEEQQFTNTPNSSENIAARFEDTEILGEVERGKVDENILQKREMEKGDEKQSVDSLEQNYHEPESMKENTLANRNAVHENYPPYFIEQLARLGLVVKSDSAPEDRELYHMRLRSRRTQN